MMMALRILLSTSSGFPLLRTTRFHTIVFFRIEKNQRVAWCPAITYVSCHLSHVSLDVMV
jgi:hypothetical protein